MKTIPIIRLTVLISQAMVRDEKPLGPSGSGGFSLSPLTSDGFSELSRAGV